MVRESSHGILFIAAMMDAKGGPDLRKSLSIKVRKKYKFECHGIAASFAKQTRHSLQPCITINPGRHDVTVANFV